MPLGWRASHRALWHQGRVRRGSVPPPPGLDERTQRRSSGFRRGYLVNDGCLDLAARLAGPATFQASSLPRLAPATGREVPRFPYSTGATGSASKAATLGTPSRRLG